MGAEVIAIPTAAVLARVLTPYDFGLAAIGTLIIQFAQRATSLGFNTALMRLPAISAAHSSTVFWVSASLGAVVWVTIAFVAPSVAAFFKNAEASGAIRMSALTFAVGALGAVPSALMARDLRFRDITLIDSAQSWLSAVSSVIMALGGFGYWSLLYSQLLATAATTVMRFVAAGWRPRMAISWAVLGELWSFGFGLQVKRILDSAALNIDNMIIGRMLGLTLLGIYDKAFSTISRAVALLSSAGPSVSVTILAKMQTEPERFRSAFGKLLLSASLVTYPAFAGAAVCAPDLFRVLFGAQWDAAIVPFQFLCLGGALRTILAYVTAAVESRGRIWGAVWWQALHLLLIAMAVAIGIRTGGLQGAAIGVSVATGVMFVCMCDLLRRIAGFSWGQFVHPQIPGGVCAAAVALATFSAGYVLDVQSSFLRLSAQFTAGTAVYILLLVRSPFSSVTILVRETLADLSPSQALFLNRMTRGLFGAAKGSALP